MAISEAEFLRQIIQLATLYGWWCMHQRPAMLSSGKWVTATQGQGKGFPDLVLVRERVLWVEVKTDKGKCTREQDEWLSRLKAAEQETYIWRPSYWASIQLTLSQECDGCNATMH